MPTDRANRSFHCSIAPLLVQSPPFRIFEQFPEVRVAILDRRSGCSSNEEAAGMAGFGDVAYIEQAHGNTIHVVDAPVAGTLTGDGLMTSTPNLSLCVRWADCQNFVIHAPRLRQACLPARQGYGGQARSAVIGVLHVGWRGLACGAMTSFYEALKQHFNIVPDETYVGAGPSLCRKCAVYPDWKNVFPESMHPFVENEHTVPRTELRSGARVDLIACAESQLDTIGVPRSHRERHPDVTCCMREKYWTNRGGDREAVQAGRGRNFLVAGILE